MNKPELLAPAGSMESLYAAVRCGADAVYAGGKEFSARAGAANFSGEELLRAVEYCHLHGVKLYRAMNILLFPEELEDFLAAARYSAEIGVDGLIIQDIGAARLVREALPDMKLSASTQMTVHTPEGVKLAKELGFSRVVAARELSIEKIAELTGLGVEIEVFIHGALCMSVSGQCLMSAMIGGRSANRSANRGMCAQPCRLPMGDGRYSLSLRDLCGIDHVKALKDVGVASFKIEGRMKRPEYVAAAVTAYRAALDGRTPDVETLRAVFSRDGFTDGYLTGQRREMFGHRQKEDVTAAEPVLPKLRELYRTEKGLYPADFFMRVKKEERAVLEMSCGGLTVRGAGDVPEKAVNRPVTEEFLRRQLARLGDTVYVFGSLRTERDEGLALSAAAVNSLRRDAVQKMDQARINAAKPIYHYNSIARSYPVRECPAEKRIRVKISEPEQLEGLDNGVDEIVVPIELCGKIPPGDRIIIAPPRFVTDEGALAVKLRTLQRAGYGRLYCENLSHVKLGRDLGFRLSGGAGLNIVNPAAAETAARLGLSDITAGPELRTAGYKRLGGELPAAAIVWGRLPLMLTVNCPIGDCGSCSGAITDRTGKIFPVRCGGGYSEILNCVPLMMTDRAGELWADILELDFTDEAPEEVRRVLRCLRQGEKALDSGYTRGLYYR